MKSKIITLFVVGFICAAGSVHAADATETWNTKCASCHSKDGSGSGVMGKKLNVKDLRDAKVQADLSDADAIKTINEGVTVSGSAKMKPYKGVLTDDEIKALVAQIRSFKK